MLVIEHMSPSAPWEWEGRGGRRRGKQKAFEEVLRWSQLGASVASETCSIENEAVVQGHIKIQLAQPYNVQKIAPFKW